MKNNCAINASLVPQHIAIVMDGNGRWATKRYLPRVAGHQQGIEALRRVTKACLDHGILVLTVFAFSSENWNRPLEEVSGLMSLFGLALAKEVKDLNEKNIKIIFPGEKNNISKNTLNALLKAENITKNNNKMILNICFDYGGRWDICQAVKKIQDNNQAVTEDTIASYLSLSHVPDPDLVIRTGGEMRMSNFLLWQMAYSELFFTPTLWPDADGFLIDEALKFYQTRERRFGRTSEQITTT